jgi:DNA-binding beta-propeller fold protein YncE
MPDGAWMKPNTARRDLIYAAANKTVLILSYPDGALQATLTGFKEPGGLCSDAGGNVFVTDYKASDIVEYAHGGTNPIGTLKDPGYHPMGCSVDPTTGNLAVANFYCIYPCKTRGNVAVYTHAQGSPTLYFDANIPWFYYCTYDGQGNLFADGDVPAPGFLITELPASGSALQDIMVKDAPYDAGSIQWDGEYLAVQTLGEYQRKGPTVIDRVQVTGKTGSIVSSTYLYSGKADRHQRNFSEYWIQGNAIIGADGPYAEIGIWPYPKGAKRPTHVIRQGTNGYAVTISH